MEYQFRPYTLFEPTTVKLTGKVYEKGEHPIYRDHKIIEVCDDEGNTNDAFEDELNVVLKETIEEVAEKMSIGIREENYKDGFIDSAKYLQDKFCDSEFLQKLRATKSDAEARRLIKNI